MIHDNIASIFHRRSDSKESLVFMLELLDNIAVIVFMLELLDNIAVIYFLNIVDRMKTTAIIM